MLLTDQEQLAAMLAPYVDSDGHPVVPLSDDLLFIKRGLDLRLLEFQEDCRRIQKTENTLQRQLDELSLGYDAMVLEAQGFAESKLMGQVKDLKKIVTLLQLELDELRFQRDVYADEAKRLRGVCRYGNWIQDGGLAILSIRQALGHELDNQFFICTPEHI
ncbi:hypothetical protein cyc_08769 [Cyclospora cayetanensis]|uniref:Uncharacterized protein n=1 Tax=Cyclospora cayetanensis TaxID=88456 RepID=A0A1D3CZV7_9EIME|nr:hypothetical protein cyc_08769 [Cyclospora cayetanensis]